MKISSICIKNNNILRPNDLKQVNKETEIIDDKELFKLQENQTS
jgi:hypothetical protein